MNLTKIRIVSMLLALCMLPFGLFGCQKSDEGDDTSETTATSSETTAATTTAPKGDGKVEEKKIGTLYNGIEIPDDWPPKDTEAKVGGSSGEIPYLISKADGGMRPEVIDISVGRQLFVDDFLIESTNLVSTYHKATKYENSPIVVPDTSADGNAVLLSSSGVWYDEEEIFFFPVR